MHFHKPIMFRMQKGKRKKNVAVPPIPGSFNSIFSYLTVLRSLKDPEPLHSGMKLLTQALKGLSSVANFGENVPYIEGKRDYLKVDDVAANLDKCKEFELFHEDKYQYLKKGPSTPYPAPKSDDSPKLIEDNENLFFARSYLVDVEAFKTADPLSIVHQSAIVTRKQSSPKPSTLPDPGSESTIDLVSPVPKVLFSPLDNDFTAKTRQILRILQELKESEQEFISALKLVRRYFVEPSLVRCYNLSTTCTPLVSLDTLLAELIRNHEMFLSTMAQRSIESTFSALEEVLTNSCYIEYTGTVTLVVHLMNVRVIPFELGILSEVAKFLERFQPKQRRQDLSVLLLLQKPIARIAKYPLFLSSILRHHPSTSFLANNLEAICNKLTEIDMQIETENIRFDTLKKIGQTMDYVGRVDKVPQSFGPLVFIGDFLVVTVKNVAWKQFKTALVLASILCHEYHLVVSEKTKTSQISYIIPFSHCQLIENVQGCLDGLMCSGNYSIKVKFRKGRLWYEILLVSLQEEEHQKFIQTARVITKVPQKYKYRSLKDLYVDPKTAIFRIDGESNSDNSDQSYEGQVFNVDLGEELQRLQSRPATK